MKKVLGLIVILMLMAVPAFAGGWDGDTYNDNSITNTATATGGAGGNATSSIVPQITVNQTGIGGPNATVNVPVLSPSASSSSSSSVGNVSGGSIVGIAPNMGGPNETLTVNTGPILSPSATGGTANVTSNNSNKIESGAVRNTNSNIQGQNQDQNQGQLQGQMQNNNQEISPTQTTTIKVEKPYMNAPSTSAPEVNFGDGKVMWGFDDVQFGVPMYKKGEQIKELIDSTANVKAKKLIKTALSMKKGELPITYNTRLLIVKKEAQKSYAVSIIGAPAGAGVLGTSGVTGSAVIGPSFAGTKANDLFDIYLVKVE